MSDNEIFIAAARDTVYGILADGWRYTNWVVGACHMRAVAPDWPTPGSKLYHSVGVWPMMRRDETVSKAAEPGRRLELNARALPFGIARIEIDLTDEGDGCRVKMREYPLAGPGKWFYNPAAEALLHRRNEESLERLAALCERRMKPQTGPADDESHG